MEHGYSEPDRALEIIAFAIDEAWAGQPHDEIATPMS